MIEIWEFLKEILPLVGLLTLIKAIIEYRNSQIWKESEFLSKEIKDFYSDDKIKKVLKILDWNVRKIEILGKMIVVDDELIVSALQTHDEKIEFTEVEAEIRDIFDTFLDKLTHLKIHIENGLISKDKLFNYLDYYLSIMCNYRNKPDGYERTINKFIDYYGYVKVRELLDDFKSNN